MSDNKPPMTVWLTGKQTPCEAVNKKHDVFSPHVPYVNLKQFMEEVERRSSECAEEGLSFDSAFVDIARKLATGIEEGKV